MALNLTEEEKKILSERITKGELDPNGPEVKQLLATRHNDDPLLFAFNFLKDHLKDQGTGEVTPSPAFHREMVHLFLTELRVGIAAPRGHAKSTVTSFIYVIWSALYEKKKNIVIVSASEDMAKRFLRRIRDEFEHNNMLLWLFGSMVTDKWSETELRLANGVVIHAKGRGAQLRGLIDGNRRPDLIILDDIEDEELVRSELRRFDLESWFNGTVLPTLEPKIGQCIFIGTILHQDSLLNRVISGDLYPDFECKRYGAMNDEEEPLWPDRFTKEKLSQIKLSYMARQQLSQYFMEYLNDPVPTDIAVFKSEFIQYFDELPKAELNQANLVEVYVDLGGGSITGRADYTAMVVLIIDVHNNIFVHDYVRERFGTDTKRMVDAMFQIHAKNKPNRWVIEKTVAANLLKATLEQEMLARNTHLNIEYITPPKGTGDRRGNMSDAKYQRIGSMEAAFKLGVIKVRKWMTALVEELLSFPRGKHDDLIDALGYGYQNVQRRFHVAKAKGSILEEDKEVEDYVPMYEEIGI